MSNVQPLPKFKIDETVLILDQPMVDDEGNSRQSALQTVVIDRVHAAPLGWLYRCAGTYGLLEERHLKPYDASKVTQITDQVGICDCIEPSVLKAAWEEAPFKPGDYAVAEETLDTGQSLQCYVVIVGVYWEAENDEWSFDTALLDDTGRFVDRSLWYYEDALEWVDPETMDALVQLRRGIKPKPALSIVHSR